MAPKNEDAGEIFGGSGRKLEVAVSMLEHRDTARKLMGAEYEGAIAPKRTVLRDLARKMGGTVLDALAKLLKERQVSDLEQMAWVAAAVDCVEEGQRGEVINLSHMRPVPDQPPAPSLPGWVRRICNGTRYAYQAKGKNVGELREWLKKAIFLDPPGPMERVEGACSVGYAFDLSFDDVDSWLFCSDVIVVGWRLDERRVGSGLLDSETEKAVRAWMEEEGKRWCPKAFRKEIREGVKARLLAAALPARRIFPIVIHRTEGWVVVSGPTKVAMAVEKRLLDGALPWRLDDVLRPEERARLGLLGDRCTDLREQDVVAVPESSSADTPALGAGAMADFLLWLAVEGQDTGRLSMEGTDLEWSLEGEAILWVPRGAEEGIVTVEVSTAEAGPFVTSLAEGGHLAALRIAVSEAFPGEGEDAQGDTYVLTLDRSEGGLKIRGVGLPKIESAGGGEDVIDAEVYSRVEFYKKMIHLLGVLIRRFSLVRMTDWGSVIERGRAWVGFELEKRFVFSAETGQGWLFPPVEAPRNVGRRSKKVTVGEA